MDERVADQGKPAREGRTSSSTPPEPASAAEAILSAWITVEVLTPQPLPDAEDLRAMRRRLIRMSDDPEPWSDPNNWKHDRERAVYWFVYLGQIDLATVTRSLLALFPDDFPEERVDPRGKTTTAVVVLDEKGRPVPEKTFLSSFAWGYGRVRCNALRELADFFTAERRIRSRIEERIIRYNTEGEIQPTNHEALQELTRWLIDELQLPPEQVETDAIAVRVPLLGQLTDTPEPELLNSLFLEDLSRVQQALHTLRPSGVLSRYLMMTTPPPRHDIVSDQALLRQCISPTRLPLARWPVNGRHPLALMQQTAVNHAVRELKDGSLMGINGPPGTGKTTLLRDIVAKVILDRAIAISELEKPSAAFSPAGNIRLGQSEVPLYRLHPSLLGHEMVVGSSNNKAVENISKVIPGMDAIADDLDPPLRYFASVSDNIARDRRRADDPPESTWGLVAAVLGKSSNRSAFAERFWWDRQRGLGQYLLGTARGWSPTGQGKDAPAEVLLLEDAPKSPDECQRRWRQALKHFRANLKNVQGLISELSASEKALQRQDVLRTGLSNARVELPRLEGAMRRTQEQLAVASEIVKDTEEQVRQARADRDGVLALRPGWWSRLFNTRRFRQWWGRLQVTVARVDSELNQAAEARRARDEAMAAAQAALRALEEGRGLVEAVARDLQGTDRAIASGRALVGGCFPDEAFWAQDDCTLQKSSPWLGQVLQNARDELFCASVALHRAFIDVNAKYLRQNLNAAMALLKNGSLSLPEEQIRRSIWASLFLVVPVVSTTFASVSRLFGSLGAEQLGWLFIDEAGQATPQAAVGALWRASRVVCIGDPLQIEPVVTLPRRLIRAIFNEFESKADEWAAPMASVQVLADRVSWLGTLLERPRGDIWVGSPLRVHRRCQDPMFTISNDIAYNGLMVYATAEKPSRIGEVLGDSAWFDVEADVEGKWSEAEGARAIEMLISLFEAGIDWPDVFFISPFRAVATRMKEILRSHRRVAWRFGDDLWNWTNDRVGTVHTFQGKEAEAVFLVLGAAAPESASARRWAGNPANLLNVAVSRAQRRLYVIGSRSAWRDVGAFRTLDAALP